MWVNRCDPLLTLTHTDTEHTTQKTHTHTKNTLTHMAHTYVHASVLAFTYTHIHNRYCSVFRLSQ